MMSSKRLSGNRSKSRRLIGSIMLCAFCGLTFGASGSAHAKVNLKTKAETAADMSPVEPVFAPQILPPHQVEVVIVLGFRLRASQHDLRRQSVRSGYSELINKAACVTATCGFVVLHDGSKWRTTNVLTASESELNDMQAKLEREGSTLVIVHPNGTKRQIPEF